MLVEIVESCCGVNTQNRDRFETFCGRFLLLVREILSWLASADKLPRIWWNLQAKHPMCINQFTSWNHNHFGLVWGDCAARGRPRRLCNLIHHRAAPFYLTFTQCSAYMIIPPKWLWIIISSSKTTIVGDGIRNQAAGRSTPTESNNVLTSLHHHFFLWFSASQWSVSLHCVCT